MRLIRLLKQDLAHEVEEWVQQDVIRADQAQAICARYGTSYPPSDRSSIGYRLLQLFGMLFLGLALIVLVGENWDAMPRGLRMGGLIALTAAIQVAALWKYRVAQHHASAGLALLGNFAYGASIILIAQIYHLGEHMPDGVFWWALGCLPWALLLKNPLLMIQTLILAAIWFLLEIDHGIYPASAGLFLLCGFWLLITGPRSISLLLTLLICSVAWIEFSLMALWSTGSLIEGHIEQTIVTVAVFMLLFVISRSLQYKDSSDVKDYAGLIDIWCLRFGLIFLFVLSFTDALDEIASAQWDHVTSMLLITSLAISITTAIAWRSGLLLHMMGMYTLLAAGTALLALGPQDYGVTATSWLVNLVLLGSGIYLIYNAINSGKSHYFFLGLVTLLATALARYFDLVGGYIGAAVLFFVFAIILLSAAKYWQIHNMKTNDKEAEANA
ncbi:MAG TPA: DUF2157 domain-containing protein [Oceanospirillaceae bacterium]|nr:DUF2157 domain-containing protein [Oceanospirillaceae bacterium]